jgi:hypothetical protein
VTHNQISQLSDSSFPYPNVLVRESGDVLRSAGAPESSGSERAMISIGMESGSFAVLNQGLPTVNKQNRELGRRALGRSEENWYHRSFYGHRSLVYTSAIATQHHKRGQTSLVTDSQR